MAYAKLAAFPTSFQDATGTPYSGGSLEFYVAGTSTPAAMYTDSAGTSLGTSCTLNSRGVPQSAGGTPVELWGDTNVVYDVTVKDSTGATVDTYDDITCDVGGYGVQNDATKGSALIGHYDPIAPSYLKTVSDILNMEPVSVLRNIPKAQWANIRNYTSAYDTSAEVDTLSAAISAAGGGKLLFPYGLFVGNYTARNGVCFEGAAPGKLLVGSYMPTTLLGYSAGSVISGGTVRGASFINLGFEGLGDGTALKGISITSGSWVRVMNCGFDSFADQAIDIQGGNSCLIVDNFAQNCLLDRTRSAKSGVLELDGADHWVIRGEYTASMSIEGSLSGVNAYCGAVLIKNGGGLGANHFIINVIGEISDFGIRVESSLATVTGARADLNYGNGFEISGGSNTFVGCRSINNSRDTSNTYDGYYVTGGVNSFAGCRAQTTGGFAAAHRYGFNDTIQSATTKNMYDPTCHSVGHGTASFLLGASNGSSVNLPSGPAKAFTDGDTTPSVADYCDYVTVNTVATSITAFDNMVPGQTFRIRAGDANTTFVHGASTIILATGANKAAGSNKIYTFYALSTTRCVEVGDT